MGLDTGISVSGNKNSINVNSGNKIINNINNNGGGTDFLLIGLMVFVAAVTVVAGYIMYIDYIVRIFYWAVGVAGAFAVIISLYRWVSGSLGIGVVACVLLMAVGIGLATLSIMDNAVTAISHEAKEIVMRYRSTFFKHMSGEYIKWTLFQIVGLFCDVRPGG